MLNISTCCDCSVAHNLIASSQVTEGSVSAIVDAMHSKSTISMKANRKNIQPLIMCIRTQNFTANFFKKDNLARKTKIHVADPDSI